MGANAKEIMVVYTDNLYISELAFELWVGEYDMVRTATNWDMKSAYWRLYFLGLRAHDPPDEVKREQTTV